MEELLWEKGDLSYLLRPNGQTRIDQFVRRCAGSAKPILVNAHRRLGKSYYPLTRFITRCLSRPGQRCVYGAPTQKQVAEIVEPSLASILVHCPTHLKPNPRGYDYRFRRPDWKEGEFSTLSLVGVDVKNGDNLRGTHMDECCLDEVRDVRRLKYIAQEVIIPQFVGRDYPVFLMITTPPESMDHEWVTYFLPMAMQGDRYLVIPGSENPDFTEHDKRMVLEAIGGSEDSVAWKREVECQLIADPEDLIVPEFQKTRDEIIVESYARPQHFQPYTIMDTGFDPDFTAILFGYVDFLNAYLVVEDEVFQRRMTTGEIHKAVRQKETELWGAKMRRKPIRAADVDPRGLMDLNRMFKLPFMPVVKYDAEAALGRLRTVVQQCKLRITKKCVRLIDQLDNGVWKKDKDGHPVDFRRTEANGHWDAGKALVYMVRMVNWKFNPYPDRVVDNAKQFYLSTSRKEEDILARALGRSRR